MCSHTDRIALIPAYQPDEKLPALAREAESKGFSVIFILVIALHRYFFTVRQYRAPRYGSGLMTTP